MKDRKQKAMAVLLLILLVTTALISCETSTNSDVNPNVNSGGNDHEGKKTQTIPVFERVWTYPGGMTVHLTNEGTATINRLQLAGTQKDYRGVCMVIGKFLEVSLTHSKSQADREYQRLSQPLLLYAVYDNGTLDVLPYENVNTGYVNAPGNPTIKDTVWVFSVPEGSTVHMGDKSASITRIELPGIDVKDYAGSYEVTSSKFVEILLQTAKLPDDKQFERLRVGILVYAIYNEETTPPSLNLYTGAILSNGYYLPY